MKIEIITNINKEDWMLLLIPTIGISKDDNRSFLMFGFLFWEILIQF